ncbi:MAG TPA: hypothetical protein VGB63_10990 [Pedobacter sp.]|jgi:hypothetical protein
MDLHKIEQEFRDELRKTYQSHEALKAQFEEDEFVYMFTIKKEEGSPSQPIEPPDKKLDSTTYQLVLAAYNAVVPV